MNLEVTEHWKDGSWASWLGAAIVGAATYATIRSFSPASADNLKVAVTHMALASATLMMLASLCRTTLPQWSRVPRALVAAVTVAMLVSTMASPRPHVAWERLLLYYATVLLGGAVYVLHRDGRRTAAPAYWLAIGIVHAAVLAEILAVLASTSLVDVTHHVPYHANVRHFGYLGYLAAGSSLALSIHSPRLAATGLLLCTAAVYGIVQLGSRGALLGWAGFAATGTLLLTSSQRWRFVIFAGACTVAAIGLVWIAGDLGLAAGSSLIERAGSGDLTSGTGRLSLWADVLRAIAKRPWWGYGPDGHGLLQCCGTYGPYVARTSQPHNVILQLLEEFGIVGGVLIAALLIVLVRRQVSSARWITLVRANTDAALLSAVLAGLFAFGMVDGPFYYPVPLMITAALAGVTMASIRQAARRCAGG
jgi:O-antigen ligase